MNAFIIAITLICQNQKLAPNPLPGDKEVVDVITRQKEAEKSCLKKLYHSCNQEVSNPDRNKLTECMAKNM